MAAAEAPPKSFVWPTHPLQLRGAERDLDYHRVVATQLRTNPSFLEVARIRMQRWIAKNGPRQPYLEWVSLLNKRSDIVAELLVARGSAGQRFRAQSPLIRMITESQQATVFKRFVASPHYPLQRSYSITYARYHLLAEDDTTWSLLEPSQRKVLDFLLLRCAHSLFLAEEFADWLVDREPFLLGSSPIDVLCAGDPLRVVRVIDAIDAGVYVFSRTIVR